MSTGELIRNAIRNPTPEAANAIFRDVIVPDPLKSVIFPIVEKLDSGVASDVLAEEALDSVFDAVEDVVLGDGVDFILDNFGDRIIDLVLSNLASIFERAAMMLVGSG